MCCRSKGAAGSFSNYRLFFASTPPTLTCSIRDRSFTVSGSLHEKQAMCHRHYGDATHGRHERYTTLAQGESGLLGIQYHTLSRVAMSFLTQPYSLATSKSGRPYQHLDLRTNRCSSFSSLLTAGCQPLSPTARKTDNGICCGVLSYFVGQQ